MAFKEDADACLRPNDYGLRPKQRDPNKSQVDTGDMQSDPV